MKRLFITGTDTNVGKTSIACALAAAFRAHGRTVATLKPIETGCAAGEIGLVPADALRLAAASGEPVPPACSLDAVCPNRYALPVSPEAASVAAGAPVDLDAIERAIARRDRADLLLVEGAGGILVPLGPGLLLVDLIRRLDMPILVVARAALGTVNHTLLTLEAARRRGLRIAGVILNRTVAAGADDRTNAEAIARHGGVRVLGTFPWVPDADFAALGQIATAQLDLEGLWQAL